MNKPFVPTPPPAPFDAAILGDGVIGLSTALELARHGASCALVSASEAGGGSGAAAGILAPSVGHRDSNVRDFFHHSLDLFPAVLAALHEFDPGLALLEGLVEIVSEAERPIPGAYSKPLAATELRRIEPSLSAPHGAVMHARDGAIDSTRLLAALRHAVAHSPRIAVVRDAAARVDMTRSAGLVVTQSGRSIRARFVVLAAGAWSPLIEGLPRAVPVFPLKGQIIALDADGVIHHPVRGDHVYLVPRDRELVVGATSEEAGFDTTTSAEAARSLHSAAIDVCPTLAGARVTRHWAGLRPATADLLPILGPDPESPSLIYACGHSRNGILLAPATAEVVRSFVDGRPSPHPALARFSISRFKTAEGEAPAPQVQA